MSGYELKSIAEQGQDSVSSNNKQKQQSRVSRDEATLPEVNFVSPGHSTGGLLTDANGLPMDRYKLVFIILLIHGIGTLMPWNMFINAEDYFREYKLMPSKNGTTPSSMITRDRTDQELEDMRKNFLSYLSIAAQLPNVLFNGLNLVVNLGSGNLNLRVNMTLAMEAAIFVLTIVLAMVNSYEWPGTFFYITLISVVLLNMASGIYQNCIFGIGAKFPMKYTNAILIGSNLSGTFTSTVKILSIWLAPEPQRAAMYYFMAALFVILICLISYNLINLNPFFRYYDQASCATNETITNAELEIATANSASLDRIGGVGSSVGASGSINNDVPDSLRKTVDAMVPRPSDEADHEVDDNSLARKWQVFKKCWPQCANVFFTFFITLAVFPSVMASIQKTGTLIPSENYFTPVACFFVFNFFAMAGNLVSGWTTWPGRDHVWIMVAARVLFIPFFLFCNFNPHSRHWPVLIHSDLAYILGNVLFALSSGYLSSLCMMFASSNLKPEDAQKGGMLAAFFLVFGIFMGVNSSFILTWIVEIG